MKLRANRRAAREAVNAVRAFFESHGCVFQEIDEGNDYGKDAYVDISSGESVTGTCVALQIKGGASFRTKMGYKIPIDAKHRQIWAESTIPIAGIVYDPVDKKLRWCNISAAVGASSDNRPRDILIDPTTVLDNTTLDAFALSFASAPKEHPLVLLCSRSEESQLRALRDCFALGRFDARVLIGVRALLNLLTRRSFRLAIRILAHLTPHPDIFWGPNNWIGTDVKNAVKPVLVWEDSEVVRLLECVEEDEWDRGNLGEDVYMLLYEDPRIKEKIELIACDAASADNQRVAFAAFNLAIYWAGDNALEKYLALTEGCPALRSLPLDKEREQTLREFGHISIF